MKDMTGVDAKKTAQYLADLRKDLDDLALALTEDGNGEAAMLIDEARILLFKAKKALKEAA